MTASWGPASVGTSASAPPSQTVCTEPRSPTAYGLGADAVVDVVAGTAPGACAATGRTRSVTVPRSSGWIGRYVSGFGHHAHASPPTIARPVATAIPRLTGLPDVRRQVAVPTCRPRRTSV